MASKWLVGCLVSCVLVGCDGMARIRLPGQDGGGPVTEPTVDAGGPTDCVSTHARFERDVWSAFMSRSCAGCHVPDGTASERGARFLLQRETYPAFIDFNLAAIKSIAIEDVAGTPKLLAKALGQAGHGGGTVLTANSDEYRALAEIVGALREDRLVTCPGENSRVFDGLELLTAPQTLRKAAMSLGGYVPSPAALAQAATDAGLDAQLDEVLRRPEFYAWLKDVWNDQLLVRKGLTVGLPGVYEFHPSEHPRAVHYQNVGTSGYASAEEYWTAVWGVVEQPLKLIEHVVREDRPFTEILTAQYTFVNPSLGDILGIGGLQTVSYANKDVWTRVDHVYSKPGTAAQVEVPLAGVLTSPGFLGRFVTTATNRSRARSRAVYRIFLGTDLFTLSQRGVDTSSLTSIINAERNNAACSVCHQVMDPIAGFFRGFQEHDGLYNFSFEGAHQWHPEMYPPGFSGALMPSEQYSSATRWGAQQLVQDKRFSLAVTQTMFRALVGGALLKYPTDPTEAAFETKRVAWAAQDDYLQGLAKQFAEAHNFSLKWLVREIVKGPYYRARSHSSTDPNLVGAFGFGRLLTPEQLSRKLLATTGMLYGIGHYTPHTGPKRHDYLLDSYPIQAGGIDSNSVTTRPTQLGALSAALMGRMAAYVACRATGFDFSKAPADRVLFPEIELGDVPLTQVAGEWVPHPQGAPKLRRALVRLHARLLNEELEPSSARIDQSFALLADAWQLLRTAGQPGFSNGGIIEGCAATEDHDNPVRDMAGAVVNHQLQPLPAARQITSDPNFTLRAWQAVVWYLLSEPRFLME